MAHRLHIPLSDYIGTLMRDRERYSSEPIQGSIVCGVMHLSCRSDRFILESFSPISQRTTVNFQRWVHLTIVVHFPVFDFG